VDSRLTSGLFYGKSTGIILNLLSRILVAKKSVSLYHNDKAGFLVRWFHWRLRVRQSASWFW